MKNNKVALAIFAVAIMLGCALVPLMSENTPGETSSASDDMPAITKDDLIKVIKTADLSDNILTHNGMTLVKVDTSKFVKKDIPATLDNDVNIDNNEIATFSTKYNESYQPYSVNGGKITVHKGGMLNILPLDDSYRLEMRVLNETNQDIIVMEYGSYLRIGEVTFIFLTPAKDASDFVNLLSLNGYKQYGGNSYLFSVGASDSTGIKLNFSAHKNSSDNDPPFAEYNWTMLDTRFMVQNEVPSSYTSFSTNYGGHYITFMLGHENYNGEGIKVDKFSLEYDSEMTEEDGIITVETTGKFSLKASIHTGSVFGRIDARLNDCMMTNSIRNDRFFEVGEFIDTGVVDFSIKTTSNESGKRTLNINTTFVSEGDVSLHTEFPSLSVGFAKKTGAEENPEKYKYRFSWGVMSDNVYIHSAATDIKFTNLRVETDITIDGYDSLYVLNGLKVSSKDMKIYLDYLGEFSAGIDKEWEIEGDNTTYNETLDYKLQMIKNRVNLLIDVDNFSFEADEKSVNLTFSAKCDSKTPYEGIEKNISFDLKNFIINLGNGSDVIGFESFDLESDYPLDQMGIITNGYEYTEDENWQTVYKYQSETDDTLFNIRSMHIKNVSLVDSAIVADELEMNFFDAEYKGTLAIKETRKASSEIKTNDYWDKKINYGGQIIGDISLTISKPIISIGFNNTVLSCKEIIGSVKNLGANEEQFSLTNNPEVRINNWLDFELISGKATFGDFWMPMTFTVDKGATFIANGTKIASLFFDEKARTSGNIEVGTNIVRFNNETQTYVLTNENPDAYTISMDLSDFGEAKVMTNKGYYLPENAIGQNYSFKADNRALGTLTLNGGTMNVNIPCSADSYKLSYKGNFVEAKNYAIGDTVTLTSKTPTEKGYTFIGWTDGTGKIFTDKYTMPARNVELRPVYMYDGEPQFYVKGDYKIEYIDAGIADIAYIPMTAAIDYFVVKINDITFTIDTLTLNQLDTSKGVYLKAMKLDVLDRNTIRSTDGMDLYDLGLYDESGSEHDIPDNGTEMYITINLRSDNVKMNWIDECGSMGSIAVYNVDKLDDGTYNVTFKVSSLRTFGFEYEKSGDNFAITIVLVIILLVVLSIGAIAFARYCRH